MNYPRLAAKFYTNEWFVREDWHRNAGQLLRPYLVGEAVAPALSRAGLGSPRLTQDGRIPGVQVSDGFALVRIEGTIGRHLDFFEVECGGGYDLAALENQILALEGNQGIHTVIFSLNSPGGIASGVPEAAGLIENLGQSKRTVAWVDNEACSACYFLAAACGEIYGQPSGIYGSISTVMAILDSSRAFEMAGLRMEVITDGKLKGMGIPGTTLSDDQRAFLEDRRDRIGTAFKSYVSERRPSISADSMEGGFYSGEDALERGLVDGFHATLSDLMADLL